MSRLGQTILIIILFLQTLLYAELDRVDSIKEPNEFVLSLIKKANESNANKIFDYRDESLKKDKEFILKVLNMIMSQYGINPKSKYILEEYMDNSLKIDREFILKVVKLNGLNFQFIDKKFKKDREVALTAFQNNSLYLSYNDWIYNALDSSLKKDKAFVLDFIMIVGLYDIDYIDEDLKKDREIAPFFDGKYRDMWDAVNSLQLNKIRLYDTQSPCEILRLKTYEEKIKLKELIESHCKTEQLLSKLNVNSKSDRRFVMMLLRQDGYILHYLNADFKKEK